MNFLKSFENWVSTYTNNLPDYLLKKSDKDYDDNIDKKTVINKIKDYKNKFITGVDIKELKNQAKIDFGEDLYLLLELNSFFKALKVKNNIDNDLALEYFDDYISEIPRIFLKIKKDYSKYDLTDKFAKLKELKNTKRSERKISKQIFKNENQAIFIEFLKMVEWIKDTKQKVLITLDGRDSAGKGSFIRLIEENMPEKVVDHVWFDIPTEREKKNWFSRYIRALPTNGHLRFYDRSWYNRAINDPVNGYCTEEEYKEFMNDVIPFAKKLAEDGIIHIKFWFSIDRETQEFRFNLRKSHPIKYWKFSPNDANALDRYDLFTFYKEQMFVKTSTKKSPWVVVDMNSKPLGQLNAMRYILNKIPYPNKNKDIIEPFKTIVYEILPKDMKK